MSEIDDKYDALLQSGLNLGQFAGYGELDDGGMVQFYEFGAIYFHPRVGQAFECHGLILDKYLGLGQNQSGLGYPVSDELDDPNVLSGRWNRFEGGSLNYDPNVGVTESYDDNVPIVPQVVVKIVDSLPLGLDRGMTLSLDELAAAVGLFPGHPLLEAVRAIIPDVIFDRLFSDLTSAEISELVTRAQQNNPSYEPPLFDNFLLIDCPDGLDTETLAAVLQQWIGIVEYAYSAAEPSDPNVVATNNPLFASQGYLKGVLQGINVQAAWAKGADGDDVRFVDLEQGWFLGHEDLPPSIPLLAGRNNQKSFDHGAAVLGIVVAKDDNRGIVGIAPKALARVISYFETVEPFNSPRVRALIASRVAFAARSLRFGDVLQLEVQIGGKINGVLRQVPVETDPAIFEAIRLVTKMGIVVVQAAGNGSSDLDQFVDKAGKHVLDVTNPFEFKDSGAIMVGACTSSSPHVRFGISNTGSRIDCWAWGENVVTTGNPNHPTQVDGYWTNPFFANTSAAAPIITGVCLLIQNLQFLLHPKPGQSGKLAGTLRDILRRPTNGTAVTGSIRPMPDMADIIANEYVP